jgi:hypothetical protein
LLSFNISVMHKYMLWCRVLDEGIVAFVLSLLVEGLKGGSDRNVVVCALCPFLLVNIIFTPVAAWELRPPVDAFTKMR